MSIDLKKENSIATITINRPEALNAVNRELIGQLQEAVEDSLSDNSIGVVVLTGAGEKAFVAGADIKAMSRMSADEALEFGGSAQHVLNLLEKSPKPVIAAVNGIALGGGTEISLACHIRIASDNAVFGQPEVHLGLIPGWGGTQRLARLVGKGKAIEMITGGGTVRAEEALRIGLVEQVVPQAALMDTVYKLARKILANGPQAIRVALDCIRRGLDISLDEGLKYELHAFGKLFETQEMQEGTTAFVAKRQPEFRK